MHSLDIMFTDPYDSEHQFPESITVAHNGDFSGDAHINMESWRITPVPETDPDGKRHGYSTVELKIPFAVLVEIVAEAVRQKKMAKLENATDREILGL